MSKFCSNCGNTLTDTDAFCEKCGSAVNNNTTEANTTNVNTTTQTGGSKIQKREIVTAILLSIVTCGIYAIYWFICLTDESNKVSGSDTASGGLALLYTLLTCGIYSYYWNYIMGQKMAEAGRRYGKNIEDRSILYLILSLFGFGIVNYCLIQNDLNTIAE